MTTKVRNLVLLFERTDSLQPYTPMIEDYFYNLSSERTADSIAERYESFVEWAREVERSEGRRVGLLPVTPSDLVAYAHALNGRGWALSSTTAYVSAIGTIHSAVNLHSPTRSREVKTEIARLRAEHADAQRHARALSGDEIKRILKTLPRPRTSRGGNLESLEAAHRRARMEKALLTTMIEAGMRVSEASALAWRDVRKEADGSGKVRVRTHWTRQRESWVVITEDCLQGLLDLKPYNASSYDKVFDISSRQISRLLKRMCDDAGIDTEGISGNTPRATLQRMLDDKGAAVNIMNDRLRILNNARG